MQRTKIIATIGPASESKVIIKKMMQAGMDIARLNMSHNVYAHHVKLIENIRQVAKELNKPIAIIADLQGPKMRTGKIANEGIPVKKNEEIALIPEKEKIKINFKKTIIPVQFTDLHKYVQTGQIIYIDDAMVELKVLRKTGKIIYCKVENESIIKSHKGINVPGAKILTSVLTEKDKKDLEFAIKNKVDYIALSFVGSPEEILDLRQRIYKLRKKYGQSSFDYKKPEQAGKWSEISTRIIAKIERPEAIANFEKILEASDAIMIARGDLGLEVPLEDLPLIQKKIIERCLEVSKTVIVATQMLNSMIENPYPTRAEVSDIANAIIDGTDAVMLSGETASGKYPIKTITIMDKIAKEVELVRNHDHQRLKEKNFSYSTTAMANKAKKIAEEIDAKAIVCTTTSGFAARSISSRKPKQKIIALTPSVLSQRQLNMSWGVYPYQIKDIKSFDKLIITVKELIIKEKIAKKGEKIVVMTSHPLGFLGASNLIKIEIL